VRRWARLLARPLAVLIVAGLFGWWLLHGQRARRRAHEDAAAPPAVASPHARAWAPRQQSEPAPGCMPETSTTCVDGDAWWVDSCGQSYALATECGDRRCEAGACIEPSPGGCGEVTALGRCDRDVARICQVDHVVEVDCHARDRRCVITDDGPQCRERTADDCVPGTASLCGGSSLRTCEDGRWRSFDCEALGGTCLPPSGRSAARCVFSLPRADPQCGACGCPPEPSVEVCDGRDNDLDGAIDEDAPCSPVPVVAFVVGDADGSGSYTDEDVAAAVAELDAAFTREDGLGLSFELREIVRLDDDALLEIDMRDVDRLLNAGTLRIASEDFYVPVVLTDVVLAEGVPRPGISTVPNGECGGQRRVWQRQPPVGLVALAKERWPTTLAHEMGHFLGLCHTHEAPPPVQRVAEGSELAEAQICDPRCVDDPDGICDTALDPGPSGCATDDECAVHCANGDRPDPRNMMAYYPPCRTMFSEEQALLMRRSLALRRGWHACTSGEGCGCDPALRNCPEEMTCRPYVGGSEGGTRWSCDLDGAALPGGRCSEGGECGGGSICVHTPDGAGHCARTCQPGLTACRCEQIDSPQVSVCSEDLRFDSTP
jgi:Pregnancy-associated plasma protein-A